MDQPIPISTELFNCFEASGIQYCHWKSNEHLLDGLSGKTDLDILVEHTEYEKVQKILEQNNCKKMISQPWRRYPDIEDWLGFDEQSGRLIHIHLHYKLVMGKRYVKELYFPYERLILNNRIRDDKTGIFICRPEIEMAILIIRVALKTGLLRIILGLFRPDFLPGNIRLEYSYLRNLISRNLFAEYLHELFGKKEIPRIVKIIEHDNAPDAIDVLKIKRIVEKKFRNHARYDFWNIQKKIILRGVQFFIARNKNKYFSPAQIKKIFSGKGAVIAVIGCDGSGKTSVVKALTEWSSWKVEVESVYLGSGDGDVGLIFKFKKKLEGFIKRIKTKRANVGIRQHHAASLQKNSLRLSANRFIQSMFSIALARERHKKVVRIQKTKAAGKVVITDRFPQNQFAGIYDGPQIRAEDNSGIFYKWLSNREKMIYNRIAEFPPDLIVKLHVPVEVSRKRKPDEKYETIQRKILITQQLKYDGPEIMDIDTSGSFQDVIRKIKTAIWNFL